MATGGSFTCARKVARKLRMQFAFCYSSALLFKTSRDCYPDFILTSSLQIDGNISSVFSCDIAITSLTIIIVMLNLFILFRTCRTLRLIFPRQILDGLPSIYQHHFILSVCLLVSVLLRDESIEESQHRRR